MRNTKTSKSSRLNNSKYKVMLQSGYKFEVKEKKVYPPLPEDIYQVELFDISMDTVDNKQKDGTVERKDVLKFQFVILDDGEYEADGQKLKVRGRSIWRNYVPTFIWEKNNEKNALYQITKAMIQRDMTEEEMKNFSSDVINSLIGYQCRVGTVNVAGKGKNADQVYTNIDKFLPKKAALAGLTAEEKEKATVKKDKENVTESAMPTQAPVMDAEIPVVGQEKKDDGEINISDVPF